MAAAKAPYIGKKQGGVDLDAERLRRGVPRAPGARGRARGAERAPARHRLHAHARRGGDDRRQGLAPEGHRPRPRGRPVGAPPHRRRRGLRAQAARLHRQGQPQGAPEGAALGAVACTPAAARSARWTRRAFDAPSTKQAAEALAGFADGGRALIVLVEGEDAAAKSFRNIADVDAVLLAEDVGVADLIGAARVVASEAALEQLTERAK